MIFSNIFVNNDAMNDKEFNNFQFTNNMIEYDYIKPEYIPFIIKYRNRFHCVISLHDTI